MSAVDITPQMLGSNGDAPDLSQYLAGLKRRRKPILLTTCALLVVAVLVALIWPPSYRTSATILIEEQEVPEDMVRSTVTSYANQQIELIRARVLTLENIMRLVQKHELYDQDELARMPRTEVYQNFIDAVDLDLLNAEIIDPRSGRLMNSTIAFTLSFEADQPKKTLQITNELANLFLNENLRTRTEKTSSTANFLREEVNKSNAEIQKLEAALSEFKIQNQSALPEVYQLNLQNVARYQSQVASMQARYQELIKREGDLVARMATTTKYSPVVLPTGEALLGDVDRLKALQSEYSRIVARYSANHPDVVRLQREIETLLVQVGGSGSYDELQRLLQSRKEELKALRANYSDDHPEVVVQRKIVDQLEAQLDDTGSSRPAPAPDNPAYLMLDNQLQTIRIEKESLEEQMTKLSQQIETLTDSSANAPVVERQYINLRRNLELAGAKNLELKAKLVDAELAGELEAGRKGQRFTLVEPPIMPEKPTSPNRPAILVLGLVLALGAGLGLGLVLEALDGSIHSARKVSELMGVPPMVTIPYLQSPAEKAAANPNRRRYWILGALVGGGLVVLLSLHLFVRPLDVLWFELLG